MTDLTLEVAACLASPHQMPKSLEGLDKAFDPNQPRVPAGSAGGGQFASTGGGDAVGSVLSNLGGVPDVQAPHLTRQLGNDPDIDILAERGQSWSKDGWSLKKGNNHACHINSARLFDKGKVDTIVTGYARGPGGYWYQHSWGLKSGKIVETTTEFDEYWGVELTGAEATKFAQYQILNRPIGKGSNLPEELLESTPQADWPEERSTPKVAWQIVEKTTRKTLYVKRRLLNAEAIRKWAATQGIATALPVDDMHVTIAFSKEEVDWAGLSPDPFRITVVGHNRVVHQFPPRSTPNGALVLKFTSTVLTDRWNYYMANGASWDFPDFQPHITITYSVPEADVGAIEPYDGPLLFGPEELAEVDDGWAGEIVEEPVRKGIPRRKRGAQS